MKTICLCYSYSFHFLRSLTHLKECYPENMLMVLVPHEFPETAIMIPGVRICPVLLQPGERWTLRSLLQLILWIRGQSPDVFVTLFDSPRLRMLSLVSGASERYWISPQGVLKKMPRNLLHGVLKSILSSFKGRLLYAYIWIHVHCSKIPPKH